MAGQIPIIDMQEWFSGSPRQKQELCDRVNLICHEIGFFYITNHGIAESASTDYMSMASAFFDLPESEKRKMDKSHSPHFRGWEQLGSELTNNQTDYREQIDIGIDREAIANPDPYYMALVGPNQWPDEAVLPGFKDTVVNYMEKLSEVSRHLLAIMSVSLGLDKSHIQTVFGKNPSPYTKLIRYPKTVAGTQGVGVHKDSGFLTLLLQDENGGLEAQSNDNQWHAVEPIPGSLVVNTGELLQLVTRNYFIATPHRVINRHTTPRYSSAFFYSPDLTTRLESLPIRQKFADAAANSPRHSNEGLMASRKEMLSGGKSMSSTAIPTVFGEKYWQRWVRSYPDIARHYYPENC
jgi:isopenicillin N synthase-like dioxygenase